MKAGTDSSGKFVSTPNSWEIAEVTTYFIQTDGKNLDRIGSIAG